jgi:hypothetical protein
LFLGAGFSQTAWIDLLPGFGLAIAQKQWPARGGHRAAGMTMVTGTGLLRRIADDAPVGGREIRKGR